MRTAIIGPQNTGKSTLIADLAKALPQYKKSVGSYRDVIKKHRLTINQQTSRESQLLIRHFLFEQGRSNREPNIFFDRCVIDNYVYSLAAAGQNGIDSDFLEETMSVLKESLHFIDGLIYIPTTVSVTLKADNVRDTDPNYIDRINTLFIDTLFDIIKLSPLPILTLSGTRDERVKKIKTWLEEHD